MSLWAKGEQGLERQLGGGPPVQPHWARTKTPSILRLDERVSWPGPVLWGPAYQNTHVQFFFSFPFLKKVVAITAVVIESLATDQVNWNYKEYMS